MDLVIHTDGGSLNNPGPSACSYVINAGDRLIREASFFLGVQTNNVAEYMGVIHALEAVDKITKKEHVVSCAFVSDSLLLVNQIKGLYKVRQPHLKPLFTRATNLIKDIGIPISFRHTLREGNVRADYLVKRELSSHS